MGSHRYEPSTLSQGTAGEEFNDPLPQLLGEPGIKLSFPLDGPLSVAARLLSPLSFPGTENAAEHVRRAFPLRGSIGQSLPLVPRAENSGETSSKGLSISYPQLK